MKKRNCKKKHLWKHVTATMAWDMYYEGTAGFNRVNLHFHVSNGFQKIKQDYQKSMRMSEKKAIYKFMNGYEDWDRSLYMRRTHKHRAIWMYY